MIADLLADPDKLVKALGKNTKGKGINGVGGRTVKRIMPSNAIVNMSYQASQMRDK
jgi:hypothetical protein